MNFPNGSETIPDSLKNTKLKKILKKKGKLDLFLSEEET